MAGFPVKIITSGGIPVRPVSRLAPAMSQADLGVGITLSQRGAPFIIQGGSLPAPQALVSFTAGSAPYLGFVPFTITLNPADQVTESILLYRTLVGQAFNANTDLFATIPRNGNMINYIAGDGTRTNRIVDPSFDVPASWQRNNSFTVAAGQAVKVSGATTSQVWQAWSTAPVTGQVFRFGADVVTNNNTLTMSAFNRDSVVSTTGDSAPMPNGTGWLRAPMTITTPRAFVGISASATRVVTLNSLYAYRQTATSLSALDYEWRAAPRTPTTTGTVAGPITTAII